MTRHMFELLSSARSVNPLADLAQSGKHHRLRARFYIADVGTGPSWSTKRTLQPAQIAKFYKGFVEPADLQVSLGPSADQHVPAAVAGAIASHY
jgi:hypothetical protein